MKFRPCIDLHNGRVKQIVGSTLSANNAPTTNFETDKPAADFARLYKADGLEGGHIAMLGAGNEIAARSALAAYPKALQIGGGITDANAVGWIEQGAQSVIVTSFVFVNGVLERDRLRRLSDLVTRERLVLDLSCSRRDGSYVVMSDRWQRVTDLQVDARTLAELSKFCGEFLIHAVDVEGRLGGIDVNLVELLGNESPIPTTYAGGIASYDDIDAISKFGNGRIDYTVGSALDIFGGSKLVYADLVARGSG